VSSIERRIEKLEELRANKSEPVWIVVVYNDTGKPSEAELEKARIEYKKEHPDWEEKDINVIYVTSENAKKLTERILAGEGTE